MKEVLALVWLALSLFGCDVGGTSIVNRVSGDGLTLRSEAYVKPDSARFRCVESSAGACHYRLLPPDCARDCQAAPLRRFTVAEGESLVLTGLPDFRIDVGPVGPNSPPPRRKGLPQPRQPRDTRGR